MPPEQLLFRPCNISEHNTEIQRQQKSCKQEPRDLLRAFSKASATQQELHVAISACLQGC